MYDPERTFSKASRAHNFGVPSAIRVVGSLIEDGVFVPQAFVPRTTPLPASTATTSRGVSLLPCYVPVYLLSDESVHYDISTDSTNHPNTTNNSIHGNNE